MKNYLIYFLLVILIISRYFLLKPTYRNGDTIRVTTTVYTDPIVYDNSQYLRLANLKIYLPIFPEIVYGDKIVIEGIVSDGVLKKPKLINIEERVGFLSKLRKRIIDFYNQTLPLQHASLIAGITLGSKSGIPKDFWESVKNTGVAHVVVASGTNITFMLSFLVSTLSIFVSRRKMIYLVILGVLLYLFVSGFNAPLIRAAIMGSIVFTAQSAGRLSTSWRVFIISALIMLAINPFWIEDLGFILSFVATGSLILFESKIRDKLKIIPTIFKESLSTSLAAQIGVTPILFVTFGQFNILSPIINMLVLWVVPAIMILGIAGGLIGLVVPIIGKLILYICYPLLSWFISIVTLFNF